MKIALNYFQQSLFKLSQTKINWEYMEADQPDQNSFKRNCYSELKGIRKAGRQAIFRMKRIAQAQIQQGKLIEGSVNKIHEINNIELQQAIHDFNHSDKRSLIAKNLIDSSVLDSQISIAGSSISEKIAPHIGSQLDKLSHFFKYYLDADETLLNRFTLSDQKINFLILSNMTAGSHQQCISLLELEVHFVFIKMLLDQDNICSDAIIGIGNMAAAGQKIKQQFLRIKIIDTLARASCTTSNIELKELCTWAVANIIKSEPLFQAKQVESGLVFFCQMFHECGHCYSEESLYHILSTLCCYVEPIFLRIYKQNGLISSLLSFGVFHYQNQANRECLSYLMELVMRFSFSSQFTGQLIKNNLLIFCEKALLNECEEKILVAHLFTLSNLAADRKRYVDYFLANKELITLLTALLEKSSQNLKRQICYIFGNAAFHASAEMISQIFRQGQVMRLMSIFLCEATEQDSIKGGLVNILKIMKLGQTQKWKTSSQENIFLLQFLDGPCVPDRLQELQYHQSEDIYKEVNILWNFIRRKCQIQTEQTI